MTETIEQESMSYNEASNILDRAVKRFMADEGIDNYGDGFRAFKRTPRGKALVDAWNYVQRREQWEATRLSASVKRSEEHMATAHELDRAIQAYANEHGLSYLQAYQEMRESPDPETTTLIENYGVLG